MSMSDPIADMLTRIRNATRAKFASVDIPASNIKTSIARVMKDEGFIRNYKHISDQKQGVLRVYLKYDAQQRNAILGLDRVSKPSRRVYVHAKNVPAVLNGMGIAILSTSRGIMTDRQARAQHVGGELLCNIW